MILTWVVSTLDLEKLTWFQEFSSSSACLSKKQFWSSCCLPHGCTRGMSNLPHMVLASGSNTLVLYDARLGLSMLPLGIFTLGANTMALWCAHWSWALSLWCPSWARALAHLLLAWWWAMLLLLSLPVWGALLLLSCSLWWQALLLMRCLPLAKEHRSELTIFCLTEE